jgi:hypothetical protein
MACYNDNFTDVFTLLAVKRVVFWAVYLTSSPLSPSSSSSEVLAA